MIPFEIDVVGLSAKLQAMVDDPGLITRPVFRVDSARYPANEMSFVDYHIACIKQNPKMNPEHYLSNLRIRIRIRS